MKNTNTLSSLLMVKERRCYSLLLLSTTSSNDNGGGVRHPFLDQPDDGIPHSVGIQAHWLNGRTLPFSQQTPQPHGSRPQIRNIEICVYFGGVE